MPRFALFRSKKSHLKDRPYNLVLSQRTPSSSTTSTDDSDQNANIDIDSKNRKSGGFLSGEESKQVFASTSKREKSTPTKLVNSALEAYGSVTVSDNVDSASSGDSACSVDSLPFDERYLPSTYRPLQFPVPLGFAREPALACDKGASHESELNPKCAGTTTKVYDVPSLALEDDGNDTASTDVEVLTEGEPRSPQVSLRSSLHYSCQQSLSMRSRSMPSSTSPASDNSVPCVEKQLAWGIELMDQGWSILSSERRLEALCLFSQATRFFGAVVAAMQAEPHNRDVAPEIVALLYTARCLRYTSSIVTNAEESVRLLYKVTQLLDRAREQVDLVNKSEICATVPKGMTEVCLDAMAIETLQFQAELLLHKLNDHQQASICYEEIIRQLLFLEETQSWANEDGSDCLILSHGIRFVSMSKKEHTEFLGEFLSILIQHYENFLCEDAPYFFDAFEDALNVLRERLEENICGNEDWVDMVSSTYKRLSEIYSSRKEDDRAALALQDFAVVKLLKSGELCSEAVDILTAIGEMHEEAGYFSKALECYELTLLALCRYYLKTGKKVARALVNVARVKEQRDGDSTESLKYWRASLALLALHDKQSTDNDENPEFRLQDYRFIMDKYCI